MIRMILTRRRPPFSTAIPICLLFYGVCNSCCYAASHPTRPNKVAVVNLIERLSSDSLYPGDVADRDTVEVGIAAMIAGAFSPDDPNAQRLQEDLHEIGRLIRDECRARRDDCQEHATDNQGIANAIALARLGPIAFRAYLDAANRQNWFGLILRGKALGRALYTETRQTEWDYEFLTDCSKAICDVMMGCGCLLEANAASDSRDSSARSVALIHALRAVREAARAIRPSDRPGLRYALFCPERQGRDIGDSARRPLVAMMRMLMDPALSSEPQLAAINAFGDATSAFDVAFQAVMDILNTPPVKLNEWTANPLVLAGLPPTALSSQAQNALDALVGEAARAFLKSVKRPLEFAGEESTYPSLVTAQLAGLLKSGDVPVRRSVAVAVGQAIPTAMDFVDVVGEMLLMTHASLDPGASHDIFGLASATFESVFALADAAVEEDPEVRKRAKESLDRMFQASGNHPNEIQIHMIVSKLIRVLAIAEDAERSHAKNVRPQEQYAVENEAFNSLLTIPSATLETVSRMEEMQRTGRNAAIRAYARLNETRLRSLAKATASCIQKEFSPATDLYRARRYLLTLRLFGEAMPNRAGFYLDLLGRHIEPTGKSNTNPNMDNLAVKRLVAQQTLDSIKGADGAKHELGKHTLEQWLNTVQNWEREYRENNGDTVMADYMRGIGGEIGRLTSEGYSIPHKLSRWFNQLSPATRGVLALSLAYSFVALWVCILWLAAPWYLADRAMENTLSEGFPLVSKRILDIITLTRWLGARDRALDAWIVRHRERLMSQTFRLGSLQELGKHQPDRVERLIANYVEIGNLKHIEAFCDAIRTDTPVAVWIEGEGGGSGKTTLACQMAYRACATGRRSAVPVVINADWEQSLLETVRRQCQLDGRLPTPTMIRNLATRGRLILLVDGLSEIRDAMDGEAEAFRYVLVTSRNRPPENRRYSTVQVSPLNVENTSLLPAFVAVYTQKEDTRQRALKYIRRLADARGCIRPVFAWLAVVNAEEHGDSSDDERRCSQLDLIMTCVMQERPRGAHALTEDSYGRAAELAAYTMLHRTWTPQVTARETVQSRLREEGDHIPFRSLNGDDIPGDAVLDQLEQSGLLRGGSVSHSLLFDRCSFVSFAHDIVAEYLAAVYVCKWAKMPPSTRKKIEHSAGGFAEILDNVRLAMTRE